MSVLSVYTFSFKAEGYTESTLIHRGCPVVISNVFVFLSLSDIAPVMLHGNESGNSKKFDDSTKLDNSNNSKNVRKTDEEDAVSNLNLIDALIENELGVTLNKDDTEIKDSDIFERIGDFQTLDYGNYNI